MRYASDLNVTFLINFYFFFQYWHLNRIKFKVDCDGVVWLISNPLTGFLFGHLKPDEVNYRLWRFVGKDIIKRTVCEGHGGGHRTHSSTSNGDFIFNS